VFRCNHPATTDIYTLSLHDALPISTDQPLAGRLKVILDNIREIVQTTNPTVSALEKVFVNTNPASTLLLGQARGAAMCALADSRSEEHTSELQSRENLVCRLLLEKK